jgi:hypothetical protein
MVETQVPQKSELIRMTIVFQQRNGNWRVVAVRMSKAE